MIQIITSFLYEVRHIIFFYIIGDLITTQAALGSGAYEANPFLISFTTALVLKLVFLILLFLVYRSLQQRPVSWNICRHSIAGIGVIATVSNMLVILWGSSLFQFTGVV
ncbi:DUF5658 family protein [uncultured Methanomethylovorans sp.]|uniref:DUF5658 family protein n=1 Tax=uncultured Methanomethylovorans sp. TaxID=183759 RepID=UPI002AA8890A|nr:DUF5658 family protein [uncultured Methanomethylovorans sp.]